MRGETSVLPGVSFAEICSNWGCFPRKAALWLKFCQVAVVNASIAHARQLVRVDQPSKDLSMGLVARTAHQTVQVSTLEPYRQ